MLPFLVLVCALSALNLVLTLGVIRRLRSHAEVIGKIDLSDHRDVTLSRPQGSTVDPFTATTTKNTELSDEQLLTTGSAAVAFLSAGCPACKIQLPEFVNYTGTLAGTRPLAVITTDDGDTGGLVEALEPVCDVIVEQAGGPMAQAFGVAGFPVFVRLDGDRVITSTGLQAQTLLETAHQ